MPSDTSLKSHLKRYFASAVPTHLLFYHFKSECQEKTAELRYYITAPERLKNTLRLGCEIDKKGEYIEKTGYNVMYTKLPKAKIRQIFQTKYPKQPPKPKRAAAAVFKFFS